MVLYSQKSCPEMYLYVASYELEHTKSFKFPFALLLSYILWHCLPYDLPCVQPTCDPSPLWPPLRSFSCDPYPPLHPARTFFFFFSQHLFPDGRLDPPGVLKRFLVWIILQWRALDAYGNILITDAGNMRIRKLTPDGKTRDSAPPCLTGVPLRKEWDKSPMGTKPPLDPPDR